MRQPRTLLLLAMLSFSAFSQTSNNTDNLFSDISEPSCGVSLQGYNDFITMLAVRGSGLELEFNHKKHIKSLIKKKIETEQMIKSLATGQRSIRSWDNYKPLILKVPFLNCSYKGSYRLTGDLADHDSMSLSSIKIELKTGSLGGIRKFKLLIPATRNDESEIFATYLFLQLGFLAPRTALIRVKVNDRFEELRLFQEDIEAHLLESNDIHENFIFGGSEAFGITQQYSLPELKNPSFITYSSDKRKAEEVLNRLTQIFLKSASSHPAVSFNSPSAIGAGDPLVNPELFGPRSRKEMRQFTALAIAMGGFLGLSKDDSRFVYDSISDRIRPIYYDGHVPLATPNLESEQYTINFVLSHEERAELLIKLKSIDLGSMIADLSALGASFSESDIRKKVAVISHNLQLIPDYYKDQGTNPKNITDISALSDWALANKKEKQDFVIKKSSVDTEFCQILKTRHVRCNPISFISNTLESFKFIASQRLDRIHSNFKNSLFLNFSLQNTSLVPRQNKILIDGIPGVDFEYSGNVKLKADSENRTIVISHDPKLASDNNAHVHLRGGSLEDWSIVVSPNVLQSNPKEGTKSYPSYLSGCLTFSDINLVNIKIDVRNTRCEDAVHFVRVKGIGISIKATNSFSDAVDVDFSDIKFSNLELKNAQNDCLDLSAGNYSIAIAEITNCSDKGISVGEQSVLKLEHLTLSNAAIGIAAKDSSKATIDNFSISGTIYCYAAYQKKSNYLGGHIKLGTGRCAANNKFKRFLQTGSTIVEI